MPSPQRTINDLEAADCRSYVLKSVNLTVPAIELQVTSLDPFVNDGDGDVGGYEENFVLLSHTANKLENYYVEDILTDILGYTSGDFDGWDVNEKLELLDDINTELFDSSFMNNHGGPVYWYALSADVSRESFYSPSERSYPLGFLFSMPYEMYNSPVGVEL